jgi:transmembrane sensor
MSVSIEDNLAEAKRIKYEAGVWVERQDGRALCDEEKAEFEAWLDASTAHRVAYWRADAAWSSANRLSALRAIETPRGESRLRRLWPLLTRAIAGAFAAALLVGGAAYYFPRDSEQTYATATGEHRAIALEDGTKITLNTDTVLHASLTRRERLIRLDHGEAFFQVKHETDRPFIVMVAGHKVTDLGTKFLIRADSGELEVALMEGRARLDTVDSWLQQHSAVMVPGDVVMATGNSLSRVTQTVREMNNALGWQRGVIVFYRTPLSEAAAEFNRYNKEKIVIASTSLRALPINGTLAANDPQQFARVLRNLFNIQAQTRGEEIVISR